MKEFINAFADAVKLIHCFIILIGQDAFWRRTLSVGFTLGVFSLYHNLLQRIPAWSSITYELSGFELFRYVFVTFFFGGCALYWLYREYQIHSPTR